MAGLVIPAIHVLTRATRLRQGFAGLFRASPPKL